MMEKINDILAFFAVLTQYPAWIKAMLAIWGCATVALVAVLIIHYPHQMLQIIGIARTRNAGNPDALNLDLRLRNPTEETAEVTELRLTFFGDEDKAGGLQAARTASAVYIVQHDPQAGSASAKRDGEDAAFDATVIYPYASDDYAILSLPVAQTIAKNDGDRIQVLIKSDALRPGKFKNAKAVFIYNGEQETEPKLLKLQP